MLDEKEKNVRLSASLQFLVAQFSPSKQGELDVRWVGTISVYAGAWCAQTNYFTVTTILTAR
jgi:hypothetical protein